MVVTKECDGLTFVLQPDVKYAHPKKDIYSIKPWLFWAARGEVLSHTMFDQTQSTILAQVGPTAIGAAIGAKYGSVASAVIGAVGGFIAGAIVQGLLTDEDGNLWVWESKQFQDWVAASFGILLFWRIVFPPVAAAMILNAFAQFGYLQVGGCPPIPIGKNPVCV